jgi:hypothetical protein
VFFLVGGVFVGVEVDVHAGFHANYCMHTIKDGQGIFVHTQAPVATSPSFVILR